MLKYSLHSTGEDSNIVVLVDGNLLSADSDHPNFQKIVDAVQAGETDIAELFDRVKAVSARLDHLSERVSTASGGVYFDGDLVDNALTKQVIRFLDEGVEDWKPLVNFFEKVMQNPSENSRRECFDWLNAREYTITPSGDFVAYKGVRVSDGVGYSTVVAPEQERVSVNGEFVVNTYVHNPAGAVVEMPRSMVDDDLNRYCSNGLHVGTFRYAQAHVGYTGNGQVLEVHVNPRDVVSVTADSSREKIRTCRYTVVDVVGQAYDAPVLSVVPSVDVEDDEFDEEYDYVCWCGDPDCGNDNEEDDDDLEVIVSVTDVTKATPIDTRLNYTKQERYPAGHPKAGQFKPKA